MTPKVAAAIDWNEWRDRYDTLTFGKQQSFYERVFEQFPEQARFDTEALGKLLDHIAEPVSVVELGGWDGAFAHEMLRRREGITRWTNFEISRGAVESGRCEDLRYYGMALEDWYWAFRHEADVFVASHVVEHLKLTDVVRAVLATDCRYIYFQAPLEEAPTSWHNYRGSHILEVGWVGLTATLFDLGFNEIVSLWEPHSRCYARRAA